MQIAIGWALLILGGLLYTAQIISSIDFKLGQRLGIQEDPKETDSVVQTLERYIAFWDLLTLGWMPLAGFLMIVDHEWWPIISLLAGAIYFDTSGREAVKNISLRQEGFRVGSKKQKKLFFFTYIFMAIIGMTLIVYSAKVLLV
ncbi:MAG: hypothetical protein DIZ78_10160 [endosymbiont of Escarpia spicata]|uniref:Uncharacterized protein n=1 Tax=endosymbiont of Escarpia spicata TaxID=2200908 RepID=A0A370DLP4_9GAMM|nr:MAG: hypothetical protein DIZ78_10160 [endosymbiont of Escarpia spicata]